MFQIIKDNLIYLLIVIALLALSINLITPKVSSTYDIISQANSVKSQLNDLQSKVNDLRVHEANKSKAVNREVKDIFELEGAQFSPEASFAPLFEGVLSVAQNSGIKIRSIDYNYQPDGDPIFAAHMPEYNVCELKILAAGTYTQLQNFFKGVMKDPNLNYLAEVELMPWDRDKTILISNIKVRLYTKTPGASSTIPKQEAPEMPLP